MPSSFSIQKTLSGPPSRRGLGLLSSVCWRRRRLEDTSNPINAVSGDFVITPEPTTALLLGLGLLGFGVRGRAAV